MFRVGNWAFLDKALLFRSAAERSTSEEYDKVLARKREPYHVTNVNERTLQMREDGLKNKILIHQATLSLFQGASVTMTGPTRRNSSAWWRLVQTRKETRNDDGLTTATSPTKSCDMLPLDPTSDMCCDSRSTVMRKIPPKRPTTYLNSLSTRSGGEWINGAKRRP